MNVLDAYVASLPARHHALLSMVIAAGDMSAADPRLFPFCSVMEERDVLGTCVKASLLRFKRRPTVGGRDDEDAVAVVPTAFGRRVAARYARKIEPAREIA